MRIAEAAALECSFAFGDHAHVGFRLVVSALTPHTGENLIRMITSARHAAKKEGVQPPHDLAKHLDTLLVDLQRSATELGIMR